MRILVHDYSGHPFQVQLSRWLAAQGHRVDHAYSADIETPRGALQPQPEDPESFSVTPLSLGKPLDKYHILKRWAQERRYGSRLLAHLQAFEPELVLSSNTPPHIQTRFLAASHKGGARFVYWLQDIYTVAMDKALRRKLPLVGGLATRLLGRAEYGALRRSDAVVCITEDFKPLLTAQGVAAEAIHVIENWAPLTELPPQPRDNDWARRHDLADKLVFLYSGTLGLKHNPGLLSALAAHFRDRPEVRVVVISNGLGRNWLEEEKRRQGLDNLILMDFLPFAELPLALGSADVLITILEPFAGILSVPSKVLSYLCAGRAMLGAIPPENLAARLISSQGAGLVASPSSEEDFLAAAERLDQEPGLRQEAAAAARRHAETAFDIDRIGAKFSEIFNPV